MIESQEKNKGNVEPNGMLSDPRGMYDDPFEDFTKRGEGGKKRCDCCFDIATTKYYDPHLEVWFDVCQNCRKFLEVEEQLESVFNSLDEKTRKNIQQKLSKDNN